jgi:glutamine phosphoribosylpyrophosphate amidotransferase
MCGVIAFTTDKFTKKQGKILRAIFRESRIRGLHAFGVVYWQGVVRLSKSLQFKDVAKAFFAIEKGKSLYLLAHNRYSTSGDWKDENNNQPLLLADSALVFNGVISMKLRSEYEQEYGENYDTENDGEIFLKHIQKGNSAEQFLKNMKGSFAGAWYHNKQLFIGRNERRPLWYGLQENGIFIASTNDILKRSGIGKPIELPANEVYRIEELKIEQPETKISQQAGRLSALPPGYVGSRRYRSRISGNVVSM